MKGIAMAAAALLAAGCAGMQDAGAPTASAKLEPRSGSKVQGALRFVQVADRVRVTGEITGHSSGLKGFHIHEKGDCSDVKAMSTGGHYNPHQSRHGAPADPVRHAGDAGNLVFNEQGVSRVDLTLSGISVSRSEPGGIIGRAFIVHMQEDDLKTDPTGNAGGRAACGIIQAGQGG